MANAKIISYVDAVSKQQRDAMAEQMRMEALLDVTAALEIVEAEIEHLRMDNEREVHALRGRLELVEKRGGGENK